HYRHRQGRDKRAEGRRGSYCSPEIRGEARLALMQREAEASATDRTVADASASFFNIPFPFSAGGAANLIRPDDSFSLTTPPPLPHNEPCDTDSLLAVVMAGGRMNCVNRLHEVRSFLGSYAVAWLAEALRRHQHEPLYKPSPQTN